MPEIWGNCVVSLEDSTLTVRAELRNRSAQPWRSEDGWAVGYHLFDDPTSTLVIDGERLPLNLLPGDSEVFAFRIATPPEPGDYAIYVSALQEHVSWLYEQGWPFLLIDVTVSESGATRLKGWRIADMRSIRIRRLCRAAGRAFYLPFQSIWGNRNLIRTLVRRDILSRYTGSFGGAFWAVLNPLLLMLTYFFVFGIVLDTKFGNDPGKTGLRALFPCGNAALARL